MKTRLIVFLMTSALLSLACSIGQMIVERPDPTETPRPTRRATFTITPSPTNSPFPTLTPSSTTTPTPTLTPTATPTPTNTPVPPQAEAEPPTNTPVPPPAEPVAQAQAPPPTATPPPQPESPIATPTPSFPFNAVYSIYDTGSPGETRFTGWVRVDYEPGKFKTLAGMKMRITGPAGQTYLSDPSGDGTADSTVAGTGDNHRMNMKIEIAPYTSGTYKIALVEGDSQVSPELEINMSAGPLQYAHVDFFKQE